MSICPESFFTQSQRKGNQKQSWHHVSVHHMLHQRCNIIMSSLVQRMNTLLMTGGNAKKKQVTTVFAENTIMHTIILMFIVEHHTSHEKIVLS